MKQVGNIVAQLKQGVPPALRHQNPYLKEAVELEGVVFTPAELAEKKLQIFPTSAPVVLEIGCYMGKTVLELAAANPELNVIGLDITYKRSAKSGRKIARENLNNARIGICDGRYFVSVVPESSLEGTCVFFPDPWKKLKQRKNRLLTEEFLNALRAKTAPGGFFWFKTDDLQYFEEAVEHAKMSGWRVSEEGLVPNGVKGERYQTAFEKLFEQKGEPHYQIIFRN